MKFNKYIIFAFALIVLGSCKKFNEKYDSLLSDPNNPGIESKDADLFLNSIQLSFKNFYGQASDFGAEVTRMQHMYGPTYSTAYQSAYFDDIWTVAYANLFKNIDAIVPVAISEKKYVHAGIANVLKAYTLVTLVDYFGDVPYAERNQGLNNTNPHPQSGSVLYDSAFALLDSAISQLKKTPIAYPTNDLFYPNSKFQNPAGPKEAARWITVANTIKLKMYVQIRLVKPALATSKINELLTLDDLIDTPDEDFVFRFGSTDNAPDSRHPKFISNYDTNGSGASDYLGNYFMYTVVADPEKGDIQDPRRRFYFYRQALDLYTSLNPKKLREVLPCSSQNPPSPDYTPFCIIGKDEDGDGNAEYGYLGRDHGNSTGIPPDNEYRTTWGVYPAGGQFDAVGYNGNNGGTVNKTMGGKGKGIYPIWLSSYTDFLKAEAAVSLGTSGDAQQLVESAIRKSINKVLSFPATVGVTVPDDLMPAPDKIDEYVYTMGALFNYYSGEDKMKFLMNEYYIALWGNGVESFNNYRRTAQPSSLQPALSSPGFFIRSFFYPSVHVNLNQNADPTGRNKGARTNDKVFWDINPDNLYH